MSNQQETQMKSSGIGFFGLLTVLFIGLKLTGYIDWEWWWVLGPLWIPLAAVLGTIGVVLGFAALFAVIVAALDR